MEVVILASGYIKHKFSCFKLSFNSPALLPINTRNVVSYIIDFYLKQNIKVNLVVNIQDMHEISKELIYYLDKINLIKIKDTKSVIETLYKSLNEIENQDLIINLVTSIPTEIADKNTYLISDKIFKTKEYSLVYNNNFLYKNDERINKGYAFTGIFRATKDRILEAIKTVGFKNDLMYIVEFLKHELKPKKTKWIDLGHEENYHIAKSLLISSRSFNSIIISEVKGELIKKSKNRIKLNNEIKYILMLPNSIKIYFPRILEYGSNFAKMEYYGYPTLAEYMLYWNLDETYWEKIFDSLKFILKEFRKYRYSIGYKAYYDFYYIKTKKRVEQFKKQISYDFLFNKYLVINNEKYKNLDLLEDKVKLKIHNLYNEESFCIMHGDFCFSNILYDIHSNIIRLIDARGSFGDNCIGIYGDIKYDIVKITHSVIGQYDYIVNNIFKIEVKNNKINYFIPKRKNYEMLKELNLNLIKSMGYSYKDILFIVGLLFVSMTPLHNDDLERQIVMYSHGIKILNEVLEGTI
jgi:hypothetical protein